MRAASCEMTTIRRTAMRVRWPVAPVAGRMRMTVIRVILLKRIRPEGST